MESEKNLLRMEKIQDVLIIRAYMELDQDRLESCIEIINDLSVVDACRRASNNPVWGRGIGITTAQCWLMYQEMLKGKKLFIVLGESSGELLDFRNNLVAFLHRFTPNECEIAQNDGSLIIPASNSLRKLAPSLPAISKVKFVTAEGSHKKFRLRALKRQYRGYHATEIINL